jgi:hypothetical protein
VTLGIFGLYLAVPDSRRLKFDVQLWFLELNDVVSQQLRVSTKSPLRPASTDRTPLNLCGGRAVSGRLSHIERHTAGDPSVFRDSISYGKSSVVSLVSHFTLNFGFGVHVGAAVWNLPPRTLAAPNLRQRESMRLLRHVVAAMPAE